MEKLKLDLINVAKQAQRIGLCKHKSGNFSVRIPNTNNILVSPSAIDREELKSEDLCILDLEGNIIYTKEGIKPSSETMMHLEIYKEREDVNAIVHTHSKFASAFAVLNKHIPGIIFEASAFGLKEGYIPVAKYARPGTVELSKSVIEPVRIADMFLLEKHGTVSVGCDIKDAFLKAQYIEEIAEIYYMTLVINKGEEPPAFTVEELNKWKYPEKFKNEG
ncbi:class II aldolase/adducin family protein [Oceanivirga salmonicida]|uniref:class II aldolase/adducin family protein n=1 Tax=Oceanivirga salmonicida TaxID=1769291 RepID=UPI0012E22B42|nr:class II aldolase/adducin family protein [Oceanivirga salmonicida]